MDLRFPDTAAVPSGIKTPPRWRVSRRKHGRGSVPVVLPPQYSWTFKRPYGEATYAMPAPSGRGKTGTVVAAFLLLGLLLSLSAAPARRQVSGTRGISPAGARPPRR